MLKVVRWYNGVPRAEINQRARATPASGSSGSHDCLSRVLPWLIPGSGGSFVFFSFGISGKAWQGNRTKGSLRNRRPSRMPKTQEEGIASVVI